MVVERREVGANRYRESYGRYYEDFEIGDVYEHRPGRTLTEYDNISFTLLTMNTHPIHFDSHYASHSEFGKPLVNSLFTLGLMIGISVNDTTIGTTVANLGMTDVKFPKPVFHGDTIRVETAVLSRRESKSRPDAGIVELEHRGFNQRGELVGSCKRQAFMRKRPVE